MTRLGINPGDIRILFLTHFHGDHTLGLPTFILYRIFIDRRPLTIVGPPGTEAQLEALFELSWGVDWKPVMKPRMQVTYVVAKPRGTAAGIRYESVRLDHGSRGCTGYRLHLGGRILAYSGDTEDTPPLDKLVTGADVAIVEATGPGDVFSHMSWEAVDRLQKRHPKIRVLWNHVYAGSLKGEATDLQVVRV